MNTFLMPVLFGGNVMRFLRFNVCIMLVSQVKSLDFPRQITVGSHSFINGSRKWLTLKIEPDKYQFRTFFFLFFNNILLQIDRITAKVYSSVFAVSVLHL